MPNLLSCPHCGQKLEADPNLYGQVVSCPTCSNDIQFPKLVAKAVVNKNPLEIETTPRYKDRQHKSEKNGDFSTVLSWCNRFLIAFIPSMIILIFFLVPKQRDNSHYSTGYDFGLEMGKRSRTYDEYDPESAKLTSRQIRMEHPETSAQIPEFGTAAYADYIRGLEDGYREGFFGR